MSAVVHLENEQTQKGISRKKQHKVITHGTNKNIILTEDQFGTIYDEYGNPNRIKRFTWKNHNKIRVQLITYGARITSIYVPGRNGVVEDIALGFEDIAGYLYYDDYNFGATIGRVTNKVENSTFEIDGKQYWLNPNDGNDHNNGGCKGFDKAIWKSYVNNTKVFLTHVSRNKDQGYPGDLFVTITYELTSKNEFRINMEAYTSKPTIVNLSNLLYVNLAGHNTGPQELYKHIVTINGNCYTKMREDGLPDGKIMNVIHTKNDFMRPILLKNVIGIDEDDGYDQNFCVNRAIDQDLCFIGRVLHTPSGRIMEIYSNQYGVNFSTSNHLGTGLVDIMQPYQDSTLQVVASDLDPFDLVNKLHEKMLTQFEIDRNDNYSELRQLIRNLYKQSIIYKDFTKDKSKEKLIELDSKNEEKKDASEKEAGVDEEEAIGEEEAVLEEESPISKEILANLKFTPMQRHYLELMKNLSVQSLTNYDEIKKTIVQILMLADALYKESSDLKLRRDSSKVSFKLEENISVNEQQLIDKEEQQVEEMRILSLDKLKKKRLEEIKRKKLVKIQNVIPTYYKDGRIHGKGNVIYKRHCALALQTQNYPNAIYHKNFPNCILRPGETYKHTIVYKFWNQGGDPSSWVRSYTKRIKKEEKLKQ